ncbi:MAG: hypothetical protein V3S64_07040, partial [bacterium]
MVNPTDESSSSIPFEIITTRSRPFPLMRDLLFGEAFLREDTSSHSNFGGISEHPQLRRGMLSSEIPNPLLQ